MIGVASKQDGRGILCRGDRVCKGPVVVRIQVGAGVKEGWCDWGHERDGHDEGERMACLWIQQLGGWGNGKATDSVSYFRDCGLGPKHSLLPGHVLSCIQTSL